MGNQPSKLNLKKQAVAEVLSVKGSAFHEKAILLSLSLNVFLTDLNCFWTLKRSATMPSWPHWPSKGFWLAAGLSLSIVLKLYLCKNTMRLRKPSQNRKVKFSKKTEPFFSRNYQILYPHSSLWLHDIIYLPGGLFCRRVHQSFRNVQSLRGELFGGGPVKGEEECYGQNCADNWKERSLLQHPGIHPSIHSSTIWK